VLFFDADNDGDLDLYSVSGGSEFKQQDLLVQDRLYLNDGNGSFQMAADALPEMLQSGSSVVAADFDRDGDLDLFVGGRIVPGSFPIPGESFFLRNDSRPGECRFSSVANDLAPGLKDIGMVCDARWTDFNNDGWPDLIVVGEFMAITFFENNGGRLNNITAGSGLVNTSGWWNSLVGGDFDRDGDTDYVVGNLGTNTHFHATAKEPLCIYTNDYNKDGRLDPVMSYYTQGVKYVGHSRDNLIDQINGMRARFRTYTDYANATFEESFLPEELADAFVVCSQTFESSYLENRGNGKFVITPLPINAQFSPVYGMVADDYDGDGNLDVLLVGNSYGPEISSGRDDASIGLYLKGNGHGGFAVVPSTKTGFLADGDTKGLAKIMVGDRDALILVGNNDGNMSAFSTGTAGRYFNPGAGDTYAIITYTDNTRSKHEFYYGSTYLSHSTRQFRIPASAKSLQVFDSRGTSRVVRLDGQ
jgi:hypothetical protein